MNNAKKQFTPGQQFSPFLNHIKFVCYLKTGKESNYKNDIETLWMSDNGEFFGFYHMSGIRAITDKLFNDCINKYKII